ncbi:MAG: aminoacyl-tRNA hydrolase [Candidatus Omnitrophota bacterium]
MKIIAGLGNPGLKYRNTRHNAGFMALEVLAGKHGIKIKKKGFSGVYGIGNINGFETLLFEPMTYMNLSGDAVKAVCSFKLKDKKDLLVIADDFNLLLGKLRLRKNGSAGGHNGLKSIAEKIGADFSRLRIGVGAGDAEGDMTDYVLGAFPRTDKAVLNETLEKAAECVEVWIREGAGAAMNIYNEKNKG